MMSDWTTPVGCEIEEEDETAEDGVSSHLIEHLSHFERPGEVGWARTHVAQPRCGVKARAWVKLETKYDDTAAMTHLSEFRLGWVKLHSPRVGIPR